MLDGKRFLPETGIPIWKSDRSSTVLELCDPEPFAVATWSVTSLVIVTGVANAPPPAVATPTRRRGATRAGSRRACAGSRPATPPASKRRVSTMPRPSPSIVVVADMPTHSPSGNRRSTTFRSTGTKVKRPEGKLPADAVGRVDHGDEPGQAGEGLAGHEGDPAAGPDRGRTRLGEVTLGESPLQRLAVGERRQAGEEAAGAAAAEAAGAGSRGPAAGLRPGSAWSCQASARMASRPFTSARAERSWMRLPGRSTAADDPHLAHLDRAEQLHRQAGDARAGTRGEPLEHVGQQRRRRPGVLEPGRPRADGRPRGPEAPLAERLVEGALPAHLPSSARAMALLAASRRAEAVS